MITHYSPPHKKIMISSKKINHIFHTKAKVWIHTMSRHCSGSTDGKSAFTLGWALSFSFGLIAHSKGFYISISIIHSSYGIKSLGIFFDKHLRGPGEIL